MAGKNDKWSMFKQYMHNELGITKEDIREWLTEAVHEEAKLLVHQAFGNFNVDKEIEKCIVEYYGFFSQKRLKDEVVKIAAEKVAERFDVTLRKVETTKEVLQG